MIAPRLFVIMIIKGEWGGKSGQRRARQSLTATGGDSRESATETKLPLTGKR